MKAIIQIQQAKVEFKSNGSQIIAVKDFSLDIAEQEFVSIVGLSGCGKTTILNLLAGFLKPTSGLVTFEGRQIEKPSSERVVVFQEDAVFPWYTVKQNISYSLDVCGVNRNPRKNEVQKYMNAVGLSSFANFFPKELSGGMKKRVDLARAYAANPKVLLMDEPFGGLDTYTRQQMQLQLLNLWESERKTILFVTHDISEAVFLSDRIVLMTPSPGSVQRILNVPFTRPRRIEIKKSNEFLKLQFEVEELIHLQDESHE